MATARTRRRPSARRRTPTSVGKPRGVLHPRVQLVGPDHFGMVCLDCHKLSSKFLPRRQLRRLVLDQRQRLHFRPADHASYQARRQALDLLAPQIAQPLLGFRQGRCPAQGLLQPLALAQQVLVEAQHQQGRGRILHLPARQDHSQGPRCQPQVHFLARTPAARLDPALG